jgi:predicted NBD/HSP70 family sugar kinase
MASETDIFEAAGVGMQVSGVRRANLRAVLTLVAVNPGISAAELARRSSLAPQTVSALLEELVQAGLVRTGEAIRGRRGQPATPHFVNSTGAYAIGVELGWKHIEAVLVDIGGNALAQYRRDYHFPDPRAVFKELRAVTRQFVSKVPEAGRSRILGVGIAAPTGIGRNVELLNADPALGAAWREIDLKAEAQKATGMEVQLFNDGNAACWAELSALPAPRPSSFAYILISTFVGAGIVAANTLWEGPTGNSANIGSMLVTDRAGKQNFVHLLASIYALERRLAAAGIEVPSTTPLFWPWEDWEPHVSEWIDDAGPALAKALLNSAAVIEYQVAIVDGVMPGDIIDRLIESVRAAMSKMPTLTFDAPEVRKGLIGGAAPAAGAAYLPLYRTFFSRDLSHIAESSNTFDLRS